VAFYALTDVPLRFKKLLTREFLPERSTFCTCGTTICWGLDHGLVLNMKVGHFLLILLC